MAMECQIGGIKTKVTTAYSIPMISKWAVHSTCLNVVGLQETPAPAMSVDTTMPFLTTCRSTV